jgi:quercetin 2,3-dioxygenase
MMEMQDRKILGTLKGVEASDGADVKLRRYIGGPELNILDPFLLLDVFGTDKASDYIGGFPPHPHRGFETVTYMLAGKMRHKDSSGNEGVIIPGGVQWMTAGRGIIHSEMPEQDEGLMKGFQVWVNLPAEKKMTDPGYQDFPPEDIPVENLKTGGSVRVVAGETAAGTVGAVHNLQTAPIFMDVSLTAGEEFQQVVPKSHTAFFYLIEGSVDNLNDAYEITVGDLAVMGEGDQVSLKAGANGGRALLVAGKIINEPVARGGPFVMNTRAEIHQAYDDYNNNKF